MRKARHREYRFYLYEVQGQTRLICDERDQIVTTSVGVCLCVCGVGGSLKLDVRVGISGVGMCALPHRMILRRAATRCTE